VHPLHSRRQQLATATGQLGPEKQQDFDDVVAWLNNPAACVRVTGNTMVTGDDEDVSATATGQLRPDKQQGFCDAVAWLNNAAACVRVTCNTMVTGDDEDVSGEAVSA
jgi:hypothetical protein